MSTMLGVCEDADEYIWFKYDFFVAMWSTVWYRWWEVRNHPMKMATTRQRMVNIWFSRGMFIFDHFCLLIYLIIFPNCQHEVIISNRLYLITSLRYSSRTHVKIQIFLIWHLKVSIKVIKPQSNLPVLPVTCYQLPKNKYNKTHVTSLTRIITHPCF